MAVKPPPGLMHRGRGLLYSWAFTLSQQPLWELPLSLWLGVISWLLLGWGWLSGWPAVYLGLWLLLLLAGHLVLVWARRQQYTAFVGWAETAVFPNPAPDNRLPYNRRVSLWVNGRFSLVNREAFVWLRPADYWQLPLGEHTLMVAEQPGRYLYQFFTAGSLLQVEPGWVFVGRAARPALALTFHLTWGPEVKMPLLSQFQFGPVVEAPTGPPRTIYLLFATLADQQQLWQHIMADWQTRAG